MNYVPILVALGILSYSEVNADELQAQLINIAAQEAQIANIGANKLMMLYGTENPIPIINRWNQIERRPSLTDAQIVQINELESQKQKLLQGQMQK